MTDREHQTIKLTDRCHAYFQTIEWPTAGRLYTELMVRQN